LGINLASMAAATAFALRLPARVPDGERVRPAEPVEPL
jgi:hypothetical protein